MLSRKLNATLRRFIIPVFLTLDIGLFVQAYLFGGGMVHIFHRAQIAAAKANWKKKK